MIMDKGKFTVGKLKEILKNVDQNSEITFGSSKFTKRPLIFNRFKTKGEKLLLIELSELDDVFEPSSENEHRPIVKHFLDSLSTWDDDYIITFGSTMDAVPLEFKDVSNVVGINLEQTKEPQWRISNNHNLTEK